MSSVLAILLTLFFVHSLVSSRLERTVVTAPIFFTAAGILVWFLFPHPEGRQLNHEVLLPIAELGLVLLLFTDASRANRAVLKDARTLPVRLLTTGMLLTILFGALAALLVLPQLSLWEAAILGAILAPTDAGLGQVIVNSPRVPEKIRQALNVEAGLNDGLSVPFLLFFIALAEASTGRVRLWPFVLEQLGFGVAVGLLVGWIGGWLLGLSHRRGWMAKSWEQLGVVTLPLFAVLGSEVLGASMFIAAFVAGLAVQDGFPDAGRHGGEFGEEWGQLLNLSVFFLFGLLVARDWRHFTWMTVAYAVLSLTVVRMLPVAVALLGSGMSRPTVWFVGWFGPRGLASIVLGLVYLEEVDRSAQHLIPLAVMATVLLSIVAHGLSAGPGAERYALAVARLAPGAPERG
jgi:sodium/hydrogen antiporter